jgi:hypothetical protein
MVPFVDSDARRGLGLPFLKHHSLQPLSTLLYALEQTDFGCSAANERRSSMGSKVANSGGGCDYATGEHYFEFHRRIIVSKAVYDEITALLQTKDYDKATIALKKVAPANAHNTIDLFLTELAIDNPKPVPGPKNKSK